MRDLQKGQSVLEALIALALASMVIVGITLAVTTSLNNAQYSKNQQLATSYAKEGTETMRYLRNNDYQAFSALTGTYCLGKDSVELTTTNCNDTTPNIDTTFLRKIDIAQNACGEGNILTRVTVSVSWKSGRCTGETEFCHKSEVVSCLSDVLPQ